MDVVAFPHSPQPEQTICSTRSPSWLFSLLQLRWFLLLRCNSSVADLPRPLCTTTSTTMEMSTKTPPSREGVIILADRGMTKPQASKSIGAGVPSLWTTIAQAEVTTHLIATRICALSALTMS